MMTRSPRMPVSEVIAKVEAAIEALRAEEDARDGVGVVAQPGRVAPEDAVGRRAELGVEGELGEELEDPGQDLGLGVGHEARNGADGGEDLGPSIVVLHDFGGQQ